MKIPVIVNRSSGKTESDRIIRELQGGLPEHELEIHNTEGPGDATRIARSLLGSDSRHIIVVGGDGTLNEAIQPMVGSSKVLIPVPAGTGSDFCRAFGIQDVTDSIAAFTSGDTVSIDTAMCTWNDQKRFFINILELGFGASVMERVNRSSSKDSKVFRRSVIRQLFRLRNYTLNIHGDSKKYEGKSPEVIIANGIFFGGGMKASPESSFTDGLLDVHIIGKLGRFSLLRRFPRLMDGTYVKYKDVTSFRCKAVTMDGNCPVEMDGEVVGQLPMKIEVVPSSVLLAVPKPVSSISK